MTFRERLSSIFGRAQPPAPPPSVEQDPEPAGESPFDTMPRPPRLQSPRDLPVVVNTEWSSVTSIRAALTDLDRGSFAWPAMMLDAMLGDSHIVAKIDDRLDGVFGAPFDMKPPAGMEEDAGALEIAEDARSMWQSVGSDQGDRMVMRDGVMLGAGLGEVIVEPGDDDWRVRLKHWHARNLWWTWSGPISGRPGYVINTKKGAEELLPDGRGGYYSTWKDEDGSERVSRWILYTPYGFQRGWVNARVKSLAIPWLLRMWAFRDWGRHSELLGIPPRKVKVPSEWDDDEKKRALREVAMMASEGIVLCPQKPDGYGFDVELLELKGPNAADVFERLVRLAEGAITVALVGQTLTTQVDSGGGNRALGQVHERVEAKIRKSDATRFGSTARNAILMPWAEFNFGSPDLAPVPTYAVDPPADLKAMGDGLNAVGVGLQALQVSGVPVDRAKVCTEAGIPVEEGVPFREYQPPQPPPAPGEEPGKGDKADPEDGEPKDDAETDEGDDAIETKAADATSSVKALFLSLRADECLKSAGVETLGALVAKSRHELRRCAGGRIRPVKEIERELEGMGLSLGMNPNDIADRSRKAARESALLVREILASGRLGRRNRAPLQGQTYVDELAENGKTRAAKILAGDVRTLKRIVMDAQPGPDGKVDGPALKAALLAAYRDMKPDQLARVMANVRLLAELSGRYATTKEVVSE